VGVALTALIICAAMRGEIDSGAWGEEPLSNCSSASAISSSRKASDCTAFMKFFNIPRNTSACGEEELEGIPTRLLHVRERTNGPWDEEVIHQGR
tara:strand:- start:197 stop:481 length:285 start_codon:yes stop_codon:yes gene_type:complete